MSGIEHLIISLKIGYKFYETRIHVFGKTMKTSICRLLFVLEIVWTVCFALMESMVTLEKCVVLV